MSLRLKYLLLLALVLLEVNARLPHHLRWNRLRRYKDLEREKVQANAKNAVKEAYYTQKLCHFNPNVTGTWQQRYFQNDEYYKDGGPQFLYIGGEGEESSSSISYPTLPIVSWAKQLGARLWDLEHRYYGQSRPLADQSVRNLLFLNSRQALEDLADFIKAKNDELKIKDPKWVVFGGSYPGALALWFRQKHPELTVGAVGSSAPIELVVDFFDYLRVCEDSYRTYSKKCADNIKTSFESLHKLLDNADGRAQVDQAFGLNPPLSQQNLTFTHLQNFYMTILGNFMVAVQYSRVNAGVFKTGASIPDVCDIMTGPGNAVAHLVKVNAYIEQQFGEDPSVTYDSYEEQVQALSDTSFDSPYSSDRSWVWQTCNEFGYFQSTTYNGIFGSFVPVNYYYNLCTDVFGAKFNVDYIRGRRQQLVDFYGRARDYNGTNVVIPNGSLDPWHALGTYAQNDPTATPYLINGTAHCADMEPPDDKTDPQGLKDVRKLIFQKLQDWTGAQPTSRASRLQVVENNAQKEVNVQQESEVVKARRAPDFEAKLCWRCGKPQNEHRPNLAPAKLQKKFEKRILAGRPVKGGFLGRAKKSKSNKSENNLDENWIEQPVDHFNDSDTRTFQQAFFSNKKHYKKGGPIFLFIGGEGAEDGSWIADDYIPLGQWAKKYNAMLYAVEHRFYGSSQPLPSMTVDNLKYLTSEQALADLANFIKTVNKDQGYKNPQWISYGGSYAGSLSAWFREVYPDITFAAIGSSGPVQADVDFYGYLQTVQASLRSYSDECANNLKEGFDAVHLAFTTVEGRNILNDKLAVYPEFTDDSIDQYDAMAFYNSILEPIMGAVQYSDQEDGVEYVCDSLTDKFVKDPIERLQAAKGGGETTWDMDDIINYFKYDSDTRAWFWQTCNEFGFYQSSDIGYNAFGSAFPVNFFLRWCTDAYNASLVRDELEKRMDVTNQKYGGARNYRSTKVLQLYGTVDPWHSIGYYPVDGNFGEDVVSIVVNGTSHCSDMNGYEDSGNPTEMKKALDAVQNYLDKWLGA